jgi:hypothetical protein
MAILYLLRILRTFGRHRERPLCKCINIKTHLHSPNVSICSDIHSKVKVDLSVITEEVCENEHAWTKTGTLWPNLIALTFLIGHYTMISHHGSNYGAWLTHDITWSKIQVQNYLYNGCIRPSNTAIDSDPLAICQLRFTQYQIMMVQVWEPYYGYCIDGLYSYGGQPYQTLTWMPSANSGWYCTHG